MTRPGNGPSEPIPWQRIFITLAERFNWTPQQVAALTFAQLHAYWNKPAEQGRIVRMELGPALALATARRRQREKWIEEQIVRK